MRMWPAFLCLIACGGGEPEEKEAPVGELAPGVYDLDVIEISGVCGSDIDGKVRPYTVEVTGGPEYTLVFDPDAYEPMVYTCTQDGARLTCEGEHVSESWPGDSSGPLFDDAKHVWTTVIDEGEVTADGFHVVMTTAIACEGADCEELQANYDTIPTPCEGTQELATR